MTTTVRLAALSASVVQNLMLQNAKRIAQITVRNAVTQAKVAVVANPDYEQIEVRKGAQKDYGESADMIPNEKTYPIYVNRTDSSLNINFENVTNSLQKEMFDSFGLFLTNDADEQAPNVRFNGVSEEIYRNKLYMSFRKLGYACLFTRYNHDRGLAIFRLID